MAGAIFQRQSVQKCASLHSSPVHTCTQTFCRVSAASEHLRGGGKRFLIKVTPLSTSVKETQWDPGKEQWWCSLAKAHAAALL